MTDKTKYKSVAIDNDCYKKIEELTTALVPGITISRAQVVRTLVDQKSSGQNANCTSVLGTSVLVYPRLRGSPQ